MIREVFVVFALAVFAFASPVPDVALSFNGRIVGGTNAPLGRFPWMVSLRMNGGHRCGGSILNTRWIVSAAHCTLDTNTSLYRVIVGSVMLNGSGGVSHAVTRIINHANYVWASAVDDVCVIQTASAIVYNSNVRDIQMGSAFIGGGVTATISGWGATANGGSAPNQLQQLNVRTITNAQCFGISNQVLCTQMPSGQGTCGGDSGSPLVAGGMQIGIAAWIWGRCGDGQADGYTRMSAYRTWIINNAR